MSAPRKPWLRADVVTGLGAAILGITWIAASGRVVVSETDAPIPERLSQTGLYRADGSIDERNRPFVPQYALWSDGAAKSRWIRLPEDESIDVSDPDAWRFPIGTTFWKEFAWGGRKVETRMIRLRADGRWAFASYVWNEEQTDAVRAPEEGIPGAYEIAPGVGHSIPAVADCRVCHVSSPATVLGFTALQLSDDRDPLAPHAEPVSPNAVTLRTLLAEGRLSPARSEWIAQPPRIRETDPEGRAALGYLSANCGGCHNSRGPLARLGLSLLHKSGGSTDSPEPGIATTMGAASKFVMPGRDRSTVIAPGAPELSVLLHRMKSRSPLSQMPPLGTVVEDDEAIQLISRWIRKFGRS